MQNPHVHPKPPLPRNFFAALPPNPRQVDSRQPYMRTKLRFVLTLAATHRWIADWLFTDPEAAFHVNIPLRPDAFHNTLAIRISHTFLDVDLQSPPSPTLCPKSLPGPASADGVCTHSHAADADLLLLPVASVDGLSIGYVFGAGKAVHGSHSCPLVCGRFAFDASARSLLQVMHVSSPSPCSTSPATVIMSVAPSSSGTREHTFFTVPRLPYSFECLPSHVLSMCCAECLVTDEHNDASLVDVLDSFFNQDDSELPFADTLLTGPLDGLFVLGDGASLLRDSPGVNSEKIGDSQLGHACDMSACSSEGGPSLDACSGPETLALPQFPVVSTVNLSDQQRCSDTVNGLETLPGAGNNESGTFDMTVLGAALAGIASSLQGSFYSSLPRHEPSYISTGCRMNNGFRNVIARLELAENSVLRSLQFQAANMYFSTTSRVRGDERLLRAPPGCESENDGNAPGRTGAILDSERAVVGAVGKPLTARQERLEAKKRRNRLSAARSNERRKERWEAQKRTLAELRDRVQVLQSRKSILLQENEVLKEAIKSR